MSSTSRASLRRKDDRIIIHFDYDCFYASVFEAENPALRSLPLAVQQKQIIVTCNYEARRRGLHKLQLITEAKKVCPEVVIVLGEQLDRFRDASKMLYRFLEAFTWNKKVERLGFDEVFMDVTDIVEYNQGLLNPHDLNNSFLQLSKLDPTIGFSFDASDVSGHTCPDRDLLEESQDHRQSDDLRTRLILGSHLARHLRHQMEEEKGYTATVGISTSKLLSKLVGNLHKPKGQTTLMPPYEFVESTGEHAHGHTISNVTPFIDGHDIGKIPGIGFKMSQRLRNHVLSRPAEFDMGLIYGGTKESVSTGDVRVFPGMGPDLCEHLLGGPGAEKGIGLKVWGLINGVDDTGVKEAKKVPSQLSIEDSYIRLDTLPQVLKEFRMLGTSLLRRMHIDLTEENEDEGGRQWIAHPRTIRLTTRPRLARHADGSKVRSFTRISRSGPMPNFVFNLREGTDAIVERLVQETLLPMFQRLHPETHGWNLSLMNIGVTNMIEAASDDGSGGGRDIGRMFKKQEEVLKDWKVEDRDIPPNNVVQPAENDLDLGIAVEPSAGYETVMPSGGGTEDRIMPIQNTIVDNVGWDDDSEDELGERCGVCGASMPSFALPAHELYHVMEQG